MIPHQTVSNEVLLQIRNVKRDRTFVEALFVMANNTLHIICEFVWFGNDSANNNCIHIQTEDINRKHVIRSLNQCKRITKVNVDFVDILIITLLESYALIYKRKILSNLCNDLT